MLSKLSRIAVLISLTLIVTVAAVGQGPPVKYFNERFVIKEMASLHAAQVTYQTTTGHGSFGSLAQLRSAGLIDQALAEGSKYGYGFVVTPNGTSYKTTATPIRYKKTGLRSYYIDQRGVLFGNDKGGALATDADVYIDTCSLFGIDQNERCTITAMRTLYGAEVTYAATVGNGSYCLIPDLYLSGLIDMFLGSMSKHGYSYGIEFTTGPSATFKINAKPLQYGVTGRTSFFVDNTGVVRGADHGGAPADQNDPPINN
ncbi:MAG: hypothetical protein ABI791_00735 [Acidobacteriota bacterium]